MRKLATASLLVVGLLLVFAAPSLAGGRGHGHGGHRHWHGGHRHWHGGPRVFVGVGPAFWWGYPYPYYYYPPPYYYTPPPVVVQEPPVYVQQGTAATPPATQQSFWYYCPSSSDYYPNVPTCSEAWIKVPPRQD